MVVQNKRYIMSFKREEMLYLLEALESLLNDLEYMRDTYDGGLEGIQQIGEREEKVNNLYERITGKLEW